MEEACVEVAVSTHNGERFVEEQLRSLLAQSYSNTRIRIRDDGSTDGTVEILRRLAKESAVIVDAGSNIGVVRSFLELLETASDDVAYLAFCDQDDLWDADKIERAVNALGQLPGSVPAMYCGNVRLVSEELDTIRIPDRSRWRPGLGNALVENIAKGCTIVLNGAAVELFRSRRADPDKLLMHDWWCYLVLSAVGEVFFDPTPAISYRQHQANVIGERTGLPFLLDRVRRCLGRASQGRVEQARELLRLFGDLMEKRHFETVTAFIAGAGSDSLVERVSYALTAPLYRQDRRENVLARLLIASGRW